MSFETAYCGSSLSSLSDLELLKEIRAGSDSHFSELYNRYFQRIYAFAHSRVHNHADAEEIAQETFTAVFRSFEAYRGQSSLLSWIYGIAKNTVYNHLRSSKAQEQRIERADEAQMLGPRQSLASGTPEEQMQMRRYAEEISECLGKLVPWQAQVFEMRHLENLSIQEICERTDRTSHAVRSSLYRVKRLLVEAAGDPVPSQTV